MSCGSKKLMGFRGALLAAGMMMLGTASTALASSPAHEQDKQRRVEVQRKVEKHKTVEVQKRTYSNGSHSGTGGSGHSGGGRGDWRDDERRREAEQQKWLAQRAEANRLRYAASKQRYEYRARQLEERRRQASRHGNSSSRHGYEHWKKDDRHPSHSGTGGSGWSRDKYEDRQERLKDKYEAKKERLKDKYEDKKRR
jgi:hypothetical protein